MRTRVKVCCIASPDEAHMAFRAGADALGFVGLGSSSPRSLAFDRIRAIVDQIPPTVTCTLLTGQSQAVDIAKEVQQTGASVVQILSRCEPAELRALASLLPSTRLVQVMHSEEPEARAHLVEAAPFVDAFLFDSGVSSGPVSAAGGTGRVHDWNVSRCLSLVGRRPFFLAGGLHAGNVTKAICEVAPFGVDVCNGVRTKGRLDREKLLAFMQAVHAADTVQTARLAS